MPTPLIVGHLSTIYHTSFILMGTDWLDRAGIRADWKLFASGPDIVKAFANGEIDLAYIGLPPAIIGIDRGVQIVCIAGGHVEGTVMVAQKEYDTLGELRELNAVLAQFKGKAIGSPPKGSIHDVIINDALEKAKLRAEVKNFAWTDFVLEALVDRQVDAAVGTPSLAVAASRACGAKVIVPPHALWPNNPSYGIVVRKGLVQQRDAILSFLSAHERASNFIRENPGDAAAMVSELAGTVDEGFVLDAYRVSPKYCAALSREFVGSTMAFVPVLKRLKYISGSLSEDRIFERSFIDIIHKDPPHYNTGINRKYC